MFILLKCLEPIHMFFCFDMLHVIIGVTTNASIIVSNSGNRAQYRVLANKTAIYLYRSYKRVIVNPHIFMEQRKAFNIEKKTLSGKYSFMIQILVSRYIDKLQCIDDRIRCVKNIHRTLEK